jgi:hypothetical protein
MCDPTAIAIGSLVIGVGSEVLKANAQNKAAAENKAAALQAMQENAKDVSLQESEQIAQSGRTIYQVDREARATQALAKVSSGEAGVEGVSVEALLGDIDRKRGEFSVAEGKNLGMVLDQLQREKVSGKTIAQSRIAQVKKADPFAVGIGIAAQGLGFWAGQINRSPSNTPSPSN